LAAADAMLSSPTTGHKLSRGIEMSLFANAVESIQIGVEDLLKNDDRRVLSAVVRL
jgi:hypothetical protein